MSVDALQGVVADVGLSVKAVAMLAAEVERERNELREERDHARRVAVTLERRLAVALDALPADHILRVEVRS